MSAMQSSPATSPRPPRHGFVTGLCDLSCSPIGAALPRFPSYEYQRSHQYRPYPLACVRDVARQVFEALAFMHSLDLVHTDIKPENICLVSGQDKPRPAGSAPAKGCTPLSTSVRVIDFGTAEFCAKSKMRHALVGTRQYRAPEVMFGSGWNATLDVWAVACVMTEMLCGRQLFPAPHEGDLEHLAYIERVRGRFPKSMLAGCRSDETSACFDVGGRVRVDVLVAQEVAAKGESKVSARLKRRAPLGEMFPDPKDADLLELLDASLDVDPAQRLTAAMALDHRFFKQARSRSISPSNPTSSHIVQQSQQQSQQQFQPQPQTVPEPTVVEHKGPAELVPKSAVVAPAQPPAQPAAEPTVSGLAAARVARRKALDAAKATKESASPPAAEAKAGETAADSDAVIDAVTDAGTDAGRGRARGRPGAASTRVGQERSESPRARHLPSRSESPRVLRRPKAAAIASTGEVKSAEARVSPRVRPSRDAVAAPPPPPPRATSSNDIAPPAAVSSARTARSASTNNVSSNLPNEVARPRSLSPRVSHVASSVTASSAEITAGTSAATLAAAALAGHASVSSDMRQVRQVTQAEPIRAASPRLRSGVSKDSVKSNVSGRLNRFAATRNENRSSNATDASKSTTGALRSSSATNVTRVRAAGKDAILTARLARAGASPLRRPPSPRQSRPPAAEAEPAADAENSAPPPRAAGFPRAPSPRFARPSTSGNVTATAAPGFPRAPSPRLARPSTSDNVTSPRARAPSPLVRSQAAQRRASSGASSAASTAGASAKGQSTESAASVRRTLSSSNLTRPLRAPSPLLRRSPDNVPTGAAKGYPREATASSGDTTGNAMGGPSSSSGAAAAVGSYSDLLAAARLRSASSRSLAESLRGRPGGRPEALNLSTPASSIAAAQVLNPQGSTRSMIASFSERVERHRSLRQTQANGQANGQTNGQGALDASADETSFASDSLDVSARARANVRAASDAMRRHRSLSPRVGRQRDAEVPDASSCAVRPMSSHTFGVDTAGATLEAPKSYGQLVLEHADQRKRADEAEIKNLRAAVENYLEEHSSPRAAPSAAQAASGLARSSSAPVRRRAASAEGRRDQREAVKQRAAAAVAAANARLAAGRAPSPMLRQRAPAKAPAPAAPLVKSQAKSGSWSAMERFRKARASTEGPEDERGVLSPLAGMAPGPFDTINESRESRDESRDLSRGL